MALSKILPASQEQYAGARNLIINGAMQVAQRGTSTTSLGYLVDRFQTQGSNLDELVATASQSTTAPSGFSSSLKINIDTAETSIASDELFRVRQKIEAQNLQHLQYGSSGANSITLSFWVRANVTGTYAVSLYNQDGYRVIGSTYAINSADTWEYKEITFSGDTSGTINNDNGIGLEINWFLSVGSNFTGTANTSWAGYSDARLGNGHAVELTDTVNNNWYITGVQLEVGKATPFEHRSYGDELARCQRYYYRHADGGDTSTASVGTGTMYSASALMCAVSFPVRMRATPTLDHLNATDAYRFWRTSGSDYFNNFNAFYDAHPLGGAMQADNNISGTQGDGGRVVLGGSSAYIAFDAEL